MNAISEYLEKTGTTQTEFGEKLKVGQAMVNQWVTRKRPVSIDRASSKLRGKFRSCDKFTTLTTSH